MKKILIPWKLVSEETKLKIVKWAYLIIVIAATITLAFIINENQKLVSDIQNNRKQTTYILCLEQNIKHDELIKFLKNENTLTPAIEEFVNILSPNRNCDTVVINLFDS